MLCEYSHTKSKSLAQTRTEIQHFFLRDCFLLVHPVHALVQIFNCLLIPTKAVKYYFVLCIFKSHL